MKLKDADEIGEVTAILSDWNNGDEDAVDRLMPVVVDRLRQLARKHLRKYSGHQLGKEVQATEIVNDAYLKLRETAPNPERLRKSEDFYALCATTIKNILIDYGRRKSAARRGGGAIGVPIDDTLNLSWVKDDRASSIEDIVTFQEVLDRLGEKYKKESQIITLKYFVCLTDDEIALTLNTSVPTVRRGLLFARAWIRREMDMLTADIVDNAMRIGDTVARQRYLAEACRGNHALLKDVQLLVNKGGKAKSNNLLAL
jgi:RNA polymerase sigma factor (TIGR02999 family)